MWRASLKRKSFEESKLLRGENYAVLVKTHAQIFLKPCNTEKKAFHIYLPSAVVCELVTD